MSCKKSNDGSLKRKLVIKTKDLKLIKKSSLYKEDVIHESVKGDFLNLESSYTIVNKQNIVTKINVTVARFENSPIEKTSECIAGIIGQRNYETVFSAISTVFNQELKVQALYALLTIPKKTSTVSCQTDDSSSDWGRKFVDRCCQTIESSIVMRKEIKHIKRRQVKPYVVTENVKKKPNKVIVHPGPFLGLLSRPQSDELSKPKLDSSMKSTHKNETLPILNFDDSSNDSIGKMSSLTVDTIPGILNDPLGIIDNVDKVIAVENKRVPVLDLSNSTNLTLLDGSVLRIPVKIEDDFHVATVEILKMVPPEHRKKLLWYQIYLDWKHSLTRDEENYLPLHLAAINGDADLVRRQSSVLRSRQESVDLTTNDNMTALQISIYRNHPMCTKILLFFGADPLVTDDEYRTCFHLAAEADPGHLRGLVKYCYWNPMKILKENEDMWKPELESKPRDYLTKYLLRKISVMFDNQGYTPLMLASKLGKYENVKILAESAPDTVNTQAPNSGNTALYLAVGSACLNASNRGNKSTVSDEFRKTIELLVELGADPTTENHAGSNVNTVLTDLHVGELSMIIANKMTAKNCNGTNLDSKVCVLLKDEDGHIVYEKLRTSRVANKEINTRIPPLIESKEKPSILQNGKKEINTAIDTTVKANRDSKERPSIIQNIKKETPQKPLEINTAKAIKQKIYKDSIENPSILQNVIKESLRNRSEINTSKQITNSDSKETPSIHNFKINPLLIETEFETIVKTEQISPIPKKRYRPASKERVVNKGDSYISTFRNFITDVTTAKIASPIPVTETSKDLEHLIFDEDSDSPATSMVMTKTGRGSNSTIMEGMSTFKNFICDVKTPNCPVDNERRPKVISISDDGDSRILPKKPRLTTD